MKLPAFILLTLIWSGLLFAQEQPQQQSANQPEVIDLGATEIRVKIETPQVQLITKRIKPDFDEIKLDRSFKKELIGEDEKINLKARPEMAEYLRIDIDKLMKTLR
ncbi:hypothetical protein [Caldithrix abyssi]|uniref:Uncharacterized protein n=1 Tax=Caldithrix abyssi DSM 13497 TaxID=880073 RepID=H1XNT6_CALAY|nr:hypothetical protein [Caldithrix abyssi]APF19771.1 hypothetical protein Cabys_3023 [Caldithrix abyssi DSM 13497]EHO39876.1 hypothetical protein Calab_0227 [Caldithrix abyssi DSM 13497]